jgi:hypothetical protein
MTEQILKEEIKHRTKRYVKNGIKNYIVFDITEAFNTYFLRGTDRKSYTLKVKGTYLMEELFTSFVVPPYMTSDEVKNNIKYFEDKILHNMADMIYEKYFN